MSSQEKSRSQRIILGRNFVESLVLTLISIEFSAPPTLEHQESIVRRLEEEIVAIGTSLPLALNTYRDIVVAILKEEFPDLIPPEEQLKSKAYLFDVVAQWIDANLHHILGDQVRVMHPRDRVRFVKKKTIQIIRTAVQATLYKLGFLTI